MLSLKYRVRFAFPSYISRRHPDAILLNSWAIAAYEPALSLLSQTCLGLESLSDSAQLVAIVALSLIHPKRTPTSCPAIHCSQPWANSCNSFASQCKICSFGFVGLEVSPAVHREELLTLVNLWCHLEACSRRLCQCDS